MKKTTWVILGATSIIAEEFARLAAQHRCSLLLIGRDNSQLTLIANDLRLRYHVDCEVIRSDFSNDISLLVHQLMNRCDSLSLFIAHSYQQENQHLTTQSIKQLVDTNLLATFQLIQTYFQKTQDEHRLIFLSSVAGCKGRAKNSLYGASKKAVSVYLEGLQQQASKKQIITVANLGFIDTHQTFGAAPIAASPQHCAAVCWKASYAGKRVIYYPFFWRYIMLIIKMLPFFVYKKLKNR